MVLSSYIAQKFTINEERALTGAISRVLSCVIIHLGQRLLGYLVAILPEDMVRDAPVLRFRYKTPSIWILLRMGFTLRQRVTSPSGELLPHPFTLTMTNVMAVCFLWHFP